MSRSIEEIYANEAYAQLQPRGCKRSQSLETKPGERGESKASSIASDSTENIYFTRHATSSWKGVVVPALDAQTAFSSKVSLGAQKKHKCKVCDKRFTMPTSLQAHMHRHTGEKAFTCDVEGCGRHFSVATNLRRHKKVHKDEATNYDGEHFYNIDGFQEVPKRAHSIDKSSQMNRTDYNKSDEDDLASHAPSPCSPASEHYHPSQAVQRPYYERPILDYRSFEEYGSMYHSLIRHPDTRPEQFYQYTDAEIEVHLLRDYHDFVRPMHREAIESQDVEREKFYEGLEQELNIDRFEVEVEFEDVKEKMYDERKAHDIAEQSGSGRVQMQFDNMRKVWRTLDFAHSDWDEREWEIFNAESR